MHTMVNSFGSRSVLKVGGREYEIHRLSALEKAGLAPGRLPFSLRILLENLLRTEDGRAVKEADIRTLCAWEAKAEPSKEIAFMPSRVLLQDFTGVPAVVDLAAMRDAMKKLGGDAKRINPLLPAELVIDHSVQVDEYGTPHALSLNAAIEFQRNKERYAFLRWGQSGFRNFAVVPPDTGIVHQVNLEYLARVVFTAEDGAGMPKAYPDTVVGTDSHTTMINGLGVLGWGVGGIEAEAAMLGQPMSMLIPQVVGFRLSGALREGSTATDLVLTVTEHAAQEGGRGEVRRVLRPRRRGAVAGRPRDHRQHGARIRRDLRHLPDRRRDAALSAAVGTLRGADRPGRRLCARAGAVPHPGHGGVGVLEHARPGSGQRGP